MAKRRPHGALRLAGVLTLALALSPATSRAISLSDSLSRLLEGGSLTLSSTSGLSFEFADPSLSTPSLFRWGSGLVLIGSGSFGTLAWAEPILVGSLSGATLTIAPSPGPIGIIGVDDGYASAPVPEPSAALLFGIGGLTLALSRPRRPAAARPWASPGECRS